MLQKLSIQNYAIIDSLETTFHNGMNMVTGETGAGKSIIMGALGLILGERADSTVLVNKEKKCVVEGVFHAEKKQAVKSFLKNYELDGGEELVLRREIAINGKSRSFINDTPVNLEQLRELSSLMVDLHQQFDALQLGENDFQRQVLDALAGQTPLVDEYGVVFRKWKTILAELESLKNQKQLLEKEADYNRFQYQELADASFKENELEETDAELKLLNNSEEIKACLSATCYELKESDKPMVQELKIIINRLQPFTSVQKELPALQQRLQSVQVELNDIAADLEAVSNHIHYDPQRIEKMNDRLSLGYKLIKKHGVKTTGELLTIQEQLEEKLKAAENMDESVLKKEKEEREIHHHASIMAGRISEGRKKQIRSFEEKVNKLLARVGMPNARIKVQLEESEMLNAHGKNFIDFLFDANLSSQFQPVKKVASGGELSRLMLCIKSLVAQKIDMPTLIFDEIDTGISGEAARQVGIIMKDLSAGRQIICITHQPQIAGKADAHFFVYKEIVNNSVKTNIRLLSNDERITAIAKMLGGEKPTAAAIENAREMVGN
jgi:DNA repair protein RecN (Recombination protein N)